MTAQSQWAASPQDVKSWKGPLADRTGSVPAEAVVRELRGIAGHCAGPSGPVADRPAKPFVRDGAAHAGVDGRLHLRARQVAALLNQRQ